MVLRSHSQVVRTKASARVSMPELEDHTFAMALWLTRTHEHWPVGNMYATRRFTPFPALHPHTQTTNHRTDWALAVRGVDFPPDTSGFRDMSRGPLVGVVDAKKRKPKRRREPTLEEGEIRPSKRRAFRKWRQRRRQKPTRADVTGLLQSGMPALQHAKASVKAGTPVGTPFGFAEKCLDELKDLKVNPYGSMTGIIELRNVSAAQALADAADQDGVCASNEEASSSATDDGNGKCREKLEECFGDGLQRFHLAERGFVAGHAGGDSFMRARIEEQEVQLNQLEEENLTLKEKLFLVQQELEELRRRMSGSSDELQEMEGDNSGVWAGFEADVCN